mmetsp:Transcript_178852/g.435133  ORF Transcript_178852/g.435133 Transcript_178852/m.435133 type:complete len:211 (-) Transcript_178852:1713-2345(-)
MAALHHAVSSSPASEAPPGVAGTPAACASAGQSSTVIEIVPVLLVTMSSPRYAHRPSDAQLTVPLAEATTSSSASRCSAVGSTMTMSANCGAAVQPSSAVHPSTTIVPDVCTEMKPENCFRWMLMSLDVVSTCTDPPRATIAPEMVTLPDSEEAFKFSRTTRSVARTAPSVDLRLKMSEALSLASTRPLIPVKETRAPVPREFSSVTPST